MNTDHHQYPRCRPHCHLQMDCGVEKAEAVEPVYSMKYRHFTFTQNSYTLSSSATLWIVSTVFTALYPSRGAYIALCNSCQPPLAASALIHSVHGLDYECPLNRSQQAQLQIQSLENIFCYKRYPSHRSAPYSGRQQPKPIPCRH